MKLNSTLPFILLLLIHPTHSAFIQMPYNIPTLTKKTIETCPTFAPRRATKRSVHDARIDEVEVIVSLGDSISAGFGALNTYQNNDTSSILFAQENRGASFFSGSGTTSSISSFISHYNSNLYGSSNVSHLPEICYGPFICPGTHVDGDALNLSQSGSMVINIHRQIDGLIRLLKGVKRKGFVLINLFVGSNDVCATCNSIAMPPFTIPLTPSQFKKHMEVIILKIKENIPYSILNIQGLMENLSQIYELTRDKPECSSMGRNLLFECRCAFSGEVNRVMMNSITKLYNEKLGEIVVPHEDKFAVIFDPGYVESQINQWTSEYVSTVDCFHPSVRTHKLLAVSKWNNLFRKKLEKTRGIHENSEDLFCPDEDSRIETS